MEYPFQIITKSETSEEGTIVIEPLIQGFGHTLGNSLRRVMLAHLPGAAPVRAKIKGVNHQFTTLKGMQEDIVELILNLKQLHIAYQGDQPETIKIQVTGPAQIKAGDLIIPSTVKIANPDLEIATLADKKSKLSLELTIQSGTGYQLAEDQGKQKLGVIPMDASFSPVTHVAYNIQATRVGRRTDFDSLVLTVKTNGTITPSAAVKQAAKILVEHFKQIVSPAATVKTPNISHSAIGSSVMKLTVEELDIPTRIANALRKGGYQTLADLSQAKTADLAKIKNIGEKSVIEIIAKLREKGIEVS